MIKLNYDELRLAEIGFRCVTLQDIREEDWPADWIGRISRRGFKLLNPSIGQFTWHRFIGVAEIVQHPENFDGYVCTYRCDETGAIKQNGWFDTKSLTKWEARAQA